MSIYIIIANLHNNNYSHSFSG